MKLDIERNFNVEVEGIREYEKECLKSAIDKYINNKENNSLENKTIINKYNDNNELYSKKK